MAEKDQVTKEKFEHAGIFNFADFYKFAHSWLRDEKYYLVSEEKYSEKISGNSKDIEARWRAIRKLSDYFRIEAKIEFRIFGLTDVEATIDGEKKKMNKGRIEITITGSVIKDPESKWETTPLYRFMRDIYNKFIIPSRVDAMENIIRNDMVGLKEQMKEFLEISGKR